MIMKKLKFLFLLIIIFLGSCQEDPPDPIIKYNLVTNVIPIEGGTINPSSGSFEEGTQINIMATSSTDYFFSGWSGSLESKDNPISLVMNSDKSLTAIFEEKQYPLNITIEGEGTVSEVLSGSKVTLTAIPSEGWYFKEWKGDVSSKENPFEITVDSPIEITVVFIRKNLLTISILGEGSVEKRVNGEITNDSLFIDGTSVELTAKSAIGFNFKEWRGDTSSSDNPIKIIVNTKKNITAFFKTKGSFSNNSIIGNWIFSEYGDGGGGGNPYGGGGGDGCDLHALTIESDNSFTINVQNYNVIGTYTTDPANNLITFYEDNQEIGTMINAEIDSVSNNLKGTFELPGVFGVSKGCNTGDPCSGKFDSAYNENLTYVPEDRFEQYLIDQGWDDVLDDYFITENVKNVTGINLEATDNWVQGGEIDFHDFDSRFSDRITDLSGIEAFVSLERIVLRGNKIDSINLTKNTNLKNFYANFNEFKGVNTDKNLKLKNFSIDDNMPDWSEGCGEITQASDSATQLSFLNNPELEMLSVPTVGLTSIDLSNNPKISFLDIIENYLTSIDLSSKSDLKEIRISSNNLQSLDITKNTKLEVLMAGNNSISEIDLSTNNGSMKEIVVGDNNLTEIECCANFPLLEVFSIAGNNITSVDLSHNPLLKELSLVGNPIGGNLDVSFMTEMWELRVFDTNIECIQLSEEQLAKYEAGEYERWALGDTPYSVDCN